MPLELDLRQKQKIRRRRFASDPLAPIRSDVASLVSALGGNTAVSAIYDIRLGVTAPSGKIVQWDDARGSTGFGPSLLPFSTSPGPAYDSVALTATFSSAGGSLTSASTFAAFDPSLNSIAYIGTVSGSGWMCGIGSATQNLNILANASADFQAGVNGTVRTVDSGVTNSTRRVAFASLVAGAGTVEVPNHIAVSAGAGAPTTVSGNVTFGGATGTTIGATGVARCLLVFAGEYSTAQRDTLKAWAVSSHGAVLA